MNASSSYSDLNQQNVTKRQTCNGLAITRADQAWNRVGARSGGYLHDLTTRRVLRHAFQGVIPVHSRIIITMLSTGAPFLTANPCRRSVSTKPSFRYRAYATVL